MIEVGFGQADITPDLHTPAMLGVDNEITEILDNISVRAVIIRQGDQQVGYLSAEVMAIQLAEQKLLRERLGRIAGMQEMHVVVSATHVHLTANTAFEVGEHLSSKYGVYFSDANYKRRFIDGCEKAWRVALDSFEKSTVRWGEATVVGIASNSRHFLKDGKMHWRSSRPSLRAQREVQSWPESTIDPVVRCLIFASVESDRRIVWFNYACHPCAAGGDGAPMVTSDFPGWAIRHIQSHLGSGWEGIFAQGTAGDVRAGKYVQGDLTPQDRLKDAKRMGAELGRAIIEALDNSQEIEPVLRVGNTKEIYLPVKDELKDPDLLNSNLEEAIKKYRENPNSTNKTDVRRAAYRVIVARHLKNHSIPVHIRAWRIGDIIQVWLPGECHVQTSIDLRRAFPYWHLFIGAYCEMFSAAYIPPPQEFPLSGYEVEVCAVNDQAYGVLIKNAAEAIQRLIP